MDKVFTVYLFRHGQTTYNRDQRFTGLHNPSLTKWGMKNAQTIAKKLKNKKIGLAIHTKLKRSKQTLNEVLKYHPECSLVMEDNRMVERNYGKLNGATHSEFIRKIGKKLYNLEVHGDIITALEPSGRKEVEKFLGEQEYNLIHRGFYVPPPGGESFAMVEKRVSSFISNLKKLIKKKRCNVAISAHGNSIRIFKKIMEKASIPQTCSWIIPYDKVFEFKIKV